MSVSGTHTTLTYRVVGGHSFIFVICSLSHIIQSFLILQFSPSPPVAKVIPWLANSFSSFCSFHQLYPTKLFNIQKGWLFLYHRIMISSSFFLSDLILNIQKRPSNCLHQGNFHPRDSLNPTQFIIGVKFQSVTNENNSTNTVENISGLCHYQVSKRVLCKRLFHGWLVLQSIFSFSIASSFVFILRTI